MQGREALKDMESTEVLTRMFMSERVEKTNASIVKLNNGKKCPKIPA